MKIVLDACVLFPTVMREVILGVAEQGAFSPVWSERILEEWALAARKIGREGEVIARGEIALLSSRFPASCVPESDDIEAQFWLPDPADIHVLATAISSGSAAIMTLNAKDFPQNLLAEHGLTRLNPDAFLCDLYQSEPEIVQTSAEGVLRTARSLSGEDWQMRALLKKARLPRLGKLLSQPT